MKCYTKYSSGSPRFFRKKIQFILIFLILGGSQANAISYTQKITLNYKHLTIKEIFKAIKIQTGYDVLWQPDQLDTKLKIDSHFNNVTLVEVIKCCIANKNLSFQIYDKSVVIKPISSHIIFSQDSILYRGKITDEKKNPLAGATVKILGSNRSTFTTSKGSFVILGSKNVILEITYIGYQRKKIALNDFDPLKDIEISMTQSNQDLGEVAIVSNGYQDLPKERATGSFETITKEQLQHSSDPNLIKRLEGITTSMNFNNQLVPVNSASTRGTPSTSPSQSPLANLTIRGKNTLNATQVGYNNQSGAVLVVIDGVASPYPIDNVNPNDVENITVLKDAAAASIWGSRAANGVIVVKTKRGNYSKPLNIFFSSNFNITEKPNLFYQKLMSTSDYIDAQVLSFNASKTIVSPPTLSRPQAFLSPVSEILGQQQNGLITSAQANDQLNALRGNDIRHDYEKYILRDALTQSYSIGIDGGSQKVTYRLSGGYDKTLLNSVSAGSDRLSLAYNTSFKPLKNLEVSAGITYTIRNTENQDSHKVPIIAAIGSPFYLYTRLADDQGNALTVPYKYRPSFISLLSSTYGNKIQDLTFKPLNDIKEGYYNTTYKNLNLNLNTNYKINNLLSAELLYNYGIGDNVIEILSKKNSFYARDLVTYYTSTSGVQSIPNGGIYTPTNINSNSQSLRGQLNFNQNWNDKHALNIILGMEGTQMHFLSKNFMYYGYDDNTLVSNNQLNFKDAVPTLYASGVFSTARIPYTPSTFADGKTRTLSTYTNAAYTYNRRYTVSGSLRRDMSSDFGVGTNKGGAPFFSVGGKWDLSAENFYNISFLPTLQFRATFGYNGNVNPGALGHPLITYSGGVQDNGLLSATTSDDATNGRLRPEKTGVLNLGVDFGMRGGRITGSFEYYRKRTTDLLAGNILDPSTGFNRLLYNTADMNGQGIDFTLNTQNIILRKFNWSSSFLFSYNRVKVVKLYTAAAKTAGDGVLGAPNYNVGADLSRIYGFSWAGLDPITGSPRGYANGKAIVVNDINSYLAVSNEPLSSAHYFGSAVPVYYGSFRNTIRYGALTVSANILFKLGYFFRRPQGDLVQYSQLFSSGNPSGAEYSKRWQNPGDELITNVPSLIYPANNFRDQFYQLADINVQKADHIRLQEVNISYSLNKMNWFLKYPRIFVNISNLGIIWRANKLGLDPDINDYPTPKSYAFGFSASF